jgi:TolB protein
VLTDTGRYLRSLRCPELGARSGRLCVPALRDIEDRRRGGDALKPLPPLQRKFLDSSILFQGSPPAYLTAALPESDRARGGAVNTPDSFRTIRVRPTALALIFLPVVATALAFPRADPRAPEPTLLTRITNAYPVFSPDGARVAYMSNADGDFDIYVIDPQLGTIEQLTDAPGRDGTPAWSPDGRRIAFQSFRDGHSQIYLMNADGTDQRNLSKGPWNDEHPFWSAAGDRILFASNRSSERGEADSIDLYEMRADGSNVRRITATPEVETYPSWSPDGSLIACRRILADGNWEVVVMNADGSNARPVASSPAVDGWPAWSPDGTQLAFTSERAGSADLYVVELKDGRLHRVTHDGASDERQASWSPDGRRLAYARYTWFPNQPFDEASAIYVLEVGKDGPRW